MADDAVDTSVQQEDDEITQLKNTINSGSKLRKSTTDRHVFASLLIKKASDLYGIEVTNEAVIEELKNCIKKEVFELQHPWYKAISKIPPKMFLTPKKLPSGEIDKIKARLVAGGHRQDRSIYTDNETSSPTVALSSVLMATAVAAHRGDKVMALDQEAAYLNSEMVGHIVEMTLGKEVTSLLCSVAPNRTRFLRKDGTMIVKLRKALYG